MLYRCTNMATVGVKWLSRLKSDLRQSSLVAVLAGPERAPVDLRVVLTGGPQQRPVLEIDQFVITSLRRVDERVHHVELGNAIDCAKYTQDSFYCPYMAVHKVSRLRCCGPSERQTICCRQL